MKHYGGIVLFLGALLLLSGNTVALDFPRGPVILTLSGTIKQENQANKAVFDTVMLRSLPQKTIITKTPWTDGVVTFEGPLLRDILHLVEAEGSRLRATALNDYVIDIPIADIEEYDVIVALQMNNREMNVRAKGPLWVIYPWSEQEALRSGKFYSRAIWQLRSIDVQ